MFVFLWASTAPIHAQSESYVDSLYKASETDEGKSDELTTPEPAAQEPAPAPAPEPQSATEAKPDDNIHFQTGQMTPDQLEQFIRNIIAQILGAGGALPGRIIIIRIPGGGCPNSPQQPPAAPSTPPSAPPSTSTDPSSSAGIAGLKAEMSAKYGISADDNQGGAKWSKRQLEEANKVLATLPAAFRNNTKSIARDLGSDMPRGVLGWVQMGIPRVHLLNASTYQGTFQGTLVHEMTHCWQANNRGLTQSWERQFWPNGRYGGPQPSSVSGYGNTQPVEDMAESVRQYWQAGASMKASNPARYEWVRVNVMGGKEF